MKIQFTCLILLLLSTVSFSNVNNVQFQASNRMEYRLEDKTKNETFNDWLDVDYSIDYFTTGLRVEKHQPSPYSGNSADQISQRYFQFQKDGVKLRVGNFYRRLGKGIIFQSFELRNVALDRIQQSFVLDRNVDGLLLEISKPTYDAALFSGKPVWLNGDIVRGGEMQYHVFDRILVGGSYLRVNSTDFDGDFHTELRSGQMGFSLANMDIYAEYAKKQAPIDRATPGEAFYLSTNLYGSNFGISFEYKDYDQFLLPFNNPPTLVKEHFVTLLNRHTHAIYANDEVGFQFEAVYSPWESTSFTGNFAQSGNHAGDDIFKFQELYGEWKQYIGEKLATRLMADDSFDKIVGDKSRKTAAAEVDFFINERHSILLDVQLQSIEKTYGDIKYNNQLFIVAYSIAPAITAGIQFEHTTDDASKEKNWTTVNLIIKINQNHDLFVTYGGRRAGLVCSGGYCQRLPEFKGLEIRLNSRF
ncbi:hypothetical protein JW960_27420 [candidate division KSB1 bacterium]|nr:hypothetical protein [candidate division KSB1 bacterium]